MVRAKAKAGESIKRRSAPPEPFVWLPSAPFAWFEWVEPLGPKAKRPPNRIMCPQQFECQCQVPPGFSVCICRSCHGADWEVHTFSGASAFDAHRKEFQCQDPRQLRRLELKTDREYPYWGWSKEMSKDALAARRGTPTRASETQGVT